MSNDVTKTRSRLSHSENFWKSRYWRVREALTDDETALNRFTSAVKDLDTFQVYWDMNGGRWDRVVRAFRFPLSITEDECK